MWKIKVNDFQMYCTFLMIQAIMISTVYLHDVFCFLWYLITQVQFFFFFDWSLCNVNVKIFCEPRKWTSLWLVSTQTLVNISVKPALAYSHQVARYKGLLYSNGPDAWQAQRFFSQWKNKLGIDYLPSCQNCLVFKNKSKELHSLKGRKF